MSRHHTHAEICRRVFRERDRQLKKRIALLAEAGLDSSGVPFGGKQSNWMDPDVKAMRQVGDIDAYRELTDQQLIGQSR